MQLKEVTYIRMRLKCTVCLAIMQAVTDSAIVVHLQQFACYAIYTIPIHMHLHTKAGLSACPGYVMMTHMVEPSSTFLS